MPRGAPAKANSPTRVQLKAVPLPLSSVRLTGDPLKKAEDLDAAYLLELQPQRMLAYLRQSAGLKPKAQGYGEWDGPRAATDRAHRGPLSLRCQHDVRQHRRRALQATRRRYGHLRGESPTAIDMIQLLSLRPE